MRANSLVENLVVKKGQTSLFDHYSIGSKSFEPLTLTAAQLTFIHIDSLLLAREPSCGYPISCFRFKTVNKRQPKLNIEQIK